MESPLEPLVQLGRLADSLRPGRVDLFALDSSALLAVESLLGEARDVLGLLRVVVRAELRGRAVSG